MPYGLYLSAAGANAQSHRLEVLSHNLANVNTTAFKPHLAMLRSRASEAIEQGIAEPGTGSVDDLSGGIQIEPSLTQFKLGPIRQTGNPTDFALQDPNQFFAILRGDRQLLTRAGNFQIDAAGSLVTPHGDPVLGAGGVPIRIDPNQPYKVSDDGAIEQAGVRQVLAVVRPRALGDLTRVGDNLFESLTSVSEVPADQRRLRSHALEASAVNPTEAMMELIEASRVYEANIRMIQTQDEAIGQLLGRVLRQ
ncbi:MAG: flagellar basal body protein [Pirellulaceae bacterium]|nr:MAG: flagellar basal body protein [Pirellulaceae bacterium]